MTIWWVETLVSISHWLDPNCAHSRAWLIGWLIQRRVCEHVAWPCLSSGLSQRDLLFWLLNGDVGLWSVPFLLNRWSLRPLPVFFVPPGGSLLLTLFIPTGGSLFLNAWKDSTGRSLTCSRRFLCSVRTGRPPASGVTL